MLLQIVVVRIEDEVDALVLVIVKEVFRPLPLLFTGHDKQEYLVFFKKLQLFEC